MIPFQFEHSPQSFVLPNGLKVVYLNQKHLHSVGIGLYVRIGSRFETLSNAGISHFLEHVLFRGNEKYPTSLAMHLDFESWGGSINAYTSHENIQIYSKIHPVYLSEGLHFFKDFISKPLFKDVDIERDIILEERLESVDEDGQDVDTDDILRSAIWGDHPLGNKIIGTPESLKKTKEQHLRAFFNEYFVASNMSLCITGSFDENQLKEQVSALFSEIPQGQTKQTDVYPENKVVLRNTSFVNQDNSQVEFSLGILGPRPNTLDYWSTLLSENYLDGGMSSILWQKIVEEKGLCYELWSSMATYSDHCLLEIGGSSAPEKLPELVENLFIILDEMKEKGISQEELELCQKRCGFQYQFLLDKVDSLNEILGIQALYDNLITMEECWKQIQSIDPTQMKKVWNQLFQKGNLSFVAIGPITKSKKKALSQWFEK